MRIKSDLFKSLIQIIILLKIQNFQFEFPKEESLTVKEVYREDMLHKYEARGVQNRILYCTVPFIFREIERKGVLEGDEIKDEVKLDLYQKELIIQSKIEDIQVAKQLLRMARRLIDNE